jgi:5'-3' exonuclease
LKALIDGDILRYEIGFASELGWKTIGEPIPWWYVEDMFNQRVERIVRESGADSYQLFLSGKNNFRNEIAKTKVYKGTRVEKKPDHFDNLTAYMKGMLDTVVTEGIEADDAMAMEQIKWLPQDGDALGKQYDTIICSRDKDLRQVPGWHYGWEIGNQPSFGPELVNTIGWILLDREGSSPKIKGTGFKFFCSQLLTGDTVDNIPGLPKCGPVNAFELLNRYDDCESLMHQVKLIYDDRILTKSSKEYLLEQGRLLWLVRRLNEDGSPQMWEIGMTE